MSEANPAKYGIDIAGSLRIVPPEIPLAIVDPAELAELRERSKDLDWLLNYLNDNVSERHLWAFWDTASKYHESSDVDECEHPEICGVKAIRELRGAK